MAKGDMKDNVQQVALDSIVQSKWDVRRYEENEEYFNALKKSIQKDGLLNPLTVIMDANKNYMLVAGRRRFRACKELGIKSVPVFVKGSDELEWEVRKVTLIENIHRRALKDTEKGFGILAVYEAAGYTKDQAIQGVKRIHNEAQRDKTISPEGTHDLSLNTSSHATFRKQLENTFKPDDKFRDICESIGYSPNRQYQFLQIVMKLKEEVLDKTERLGLSTAKKTLLTHSGLQQHPKIVKQLATEIQHKPIEQARAKVYQTVRDLETGALEKDGKSYVIHDSMREKISENKPIPAAASYYLPIMGAFLKIIHPLTGRQLSRGETEYTDDMIKAAKPHQLALVKSLGHRELLSLNNNMISLNQAINQILDIIDQEFETREKKKEMIKE